jgi:hypothetical protein
MMATLKRQYLFLLPIALGILSFFLVVGPKPLNPNYIGWLFGRLDPTQQYLGAGWPIPEPWGTWSNGPSAKIDLPLPDQQAQFLILNVRALVNGRHPSQNIDILINGKTRTKVRAEQFDKNEVQIPLRSSDWADQPLHIELLFQNPASPKSLGMGSDDRLMSIGLISGSYK